MSEEPARKATARLPRAIRREHAARDALRTYLRDLHADHFGAVPPRDEEVQLRLRLKVRPGSDWSLEFDPPLAEQLADQLAEWQAGRNVYRPGRAYCFRCDTSECEHTFPPTPLSVFRGYAPNGIPEWHELPQAFLAAGDERVDRLYKPGSGAAALFESGHQLRLKQLPSFGRSSRTYSILAQVVAGFFPLPAGRAPRPPGSTRLAITFQVVESRSADGEFRLHLNMLAGLPEEGELQDLLASGWQPALYRAWKTAEHEVAKLEQLAIDAQKNSRPEDVRAVLRGVPGVLHHLAESLERGGRQADRRTRHVEQRRREQRPVHKALEDVRAATTGAVFADEKEGTTVICGPQSRAHVFNADGRHVTSFTLRPRAVEFRLRTRRWRVMTPTETAEAKLRIQHYKPDQKASGPPPSA